MNEWIWGLPGAGCEVLDKWTQWTIALGSVVNGGTRWFEHKAMDRLVSYNTDILYSCKYCIGIF